MSAQKKPLSTISANAGAMPGRTRATKSPCTRSQTRQSLDCVAAPAHTAPLDELPEELLVHALCHLARHEAVPGGLEPGEALLLAGSDAIVLGPSSRAMRICQSTALVSQRWRRLVQSTAPWKQLHEMAHSDGTLNWGHFSIVQGDAGGTTWAASSTVREEGKQDKWHTVEHIESRERFVMLVRKCNEEGVSYDIVRWVGCLQGMHHPCIAALKLVSAVHDRTPFYDKSTHEETPGITHVNAAFEYADTSLQKVVYGTLERTSHTVIGRALPSIMLRSWLYQLLSALAYSHARGVPHGNLAPYRVLALTLDAAADEYLVKLGDFGFSPPAAAQCNEELPIRPSRASPELGADCPRKRYGTANDLWALGTVFAEAACGNRDPTVYMMIQELEQTTDAKMAENLPMLSDEGRDLMRRLMRYEPTDRITAAAGLCHPYFEGIHDQCAVVSRYLPRSTPPPPQFLELSLPRAWTPGQDFMAKQTDVNSRMWTILFDWLSVVSHKFKFVPRSLQLACDFMRRYLAIVDVKRERLQLVGIGALCLACKHEEVMIPNMNDFVFICDQAYPLEDLMDIEIEMMNTLDLHLNMPTTHDHLLPMLRSFDAAPIHPDGDEPLPLMAWCECLTLIGLSRHKVALCGPEVLARCIATLGALISRGLVDEVVLSDGSRAPGKLGSKLRHRVSYLQSPADWDCLAELMESLQTTLCENREILIKCHPKYIELKKLHDVLDDYSDMPKRNVNHLKAKVSPALSPRRPCCTRPFRSRARHAPDCRTRSPAPHPPPRLAHAGRAQHARQALLCRALHRAQEVQRVPVGLRHVGRQEGGLHARHDDRPAGRLQRFLRHPRHRAATAARALRLNTCGRLQRNATRSCKLAQPEDGWVLHSGRTRSACFQDVIGYRVVPCADETSAMPLEYSGCSLACGWCLTVR